MHQNENVKKYYTRSEVEKILNVKSTRIKQFISDGRLTAEKRQGQWFITAESLDKLCKMREETLTTDCRQSDGRSDDTPDDQSSKLLNQLLQEKNNQINYLKNQIQILQDEKNRLINLHEQKELRKDILLKETLTQLKQNEENLNKYQELSNNIIKSIDYIKEKNIDLIDTNKRRIAIIEDDTDQADILKLNLSKIGYEVFLFSNLIESTKYYIKDIFDLTLLDLNLSKTDSLSGEQFIDILNKFGKTTPIIIISGESESRINSAMHQTNALCYLKKPLNISELIKKIQEVFSYE